MAGIGIDFILRGSSASFTKAVAAANNSVKDLKKGLKDFDVGNGFKQALGVGGVIAGFKIAISHAMELRDELDKMGKPVEAGTRSVAEFGDSLSKVSGMAKDAGVKILSIFTGIGDGIRHIAQNTSKEQEEYYRKMVVATAKAADEAEARLKKSKEDNSPEKQEAAQEKLRKATRDGANEAIGDQKKLNEILGDKADLMEKIRKEPPKTVRATEMQTQLKQLEAAEKETRASMDKAAKDKEDKRQLQAIENMDQTNAAQREQRDAAEKDAAEKKRALLDKVGLSVEQLAEQDIGTGVGGNDPRMRARKALQLEERARTFGSRGDIKTALDLQGQAEGIRKGLSGVTADSKMLTPDTAKTAFADALKDTNTKLDDLEKVMSGIIKAQK